MRYAPLVVLAWMFHSTSAVSAEPAWAPALQAELARRAADGSFSGSVLIANQERILFTQATGEADRQHQAPNTVDTKFRFGSTGKMFTAVAIAQLAQAGKLRFDDPLGKYLKDYPNPETAKVTLHQLLTHTGGTGDIFGPGFMERRAQLKTLGDYVDAFGARAPEFPPGSRHQYSNYGFILLDLYAYGFENITLRNGLHRIGHGGGAPGMNGVLAIYPEAGYVVAVLANLDPPAAMNVDRFIAEEVISQTATR